MSTLLAIDVKNHGALTVRSKTPFRWSTRATDILSLPIDSIRAHGLVIIEERALPEQAQQIVDQFARAQGLTWAAAKKLTQTGWLTVQTNVTATVLADGKKDMLKKARDLAMDLEYKGGFSVRVNWPKTAL